MTTIVDKIKDVELLKFTRSNYYDYGTSVLEDRAIPDYRDGLNPVMRRILWATHDLGVTSKSKRVKSARTVGSVLGLFHPHGDTSVYGAMVGATQNQSVHAFIDGAGNWGNMSDTSFAAMRYTEMRLSKLIDAVCFDKFYIPIVDKVATYDGTTKEPLLLPSLLPLLFLNGKSGVAPGAKVDVPACTLDSLIKTLGKVYKGEELTPKLLYKTLKFTSKYGGSEVPIETDEDRESRKSLFVTAKGSFKLSSTWTVSKNIITVTKFANLSNMEKLLESLLKHPLVKDARDDSTKTDKYGTLTIVLKKGSTPEDADNVCKKYLVSKETCILNFTERFIETDGQVRAKILNCSMTEVFKKWITWRTELEVLACSHWISDIDKQVKHLDLMCLAVDNRKLIIESLDKDLSQKDLEAWLADKLGISIQDSAVIYELRIKQLRRLEKDSLLEQKTKLLEQKKKLKDRKAKPHDYMFEQLSAIQVAIG